MKTISIKFKYEDESYNLKAILKDDMTLSNSKSNQATDLIEDFGEPGRWSLIFEPTTEMMIEVIMYRDSMGRMTTEAEYAIIWGGTDRDAILDTIKVKSTTKIR